MATTNDANSDTGDAVRLPSTTRYWKFVRRPAGTEEASESCWAVHERELPLPLAPDTILVRSVFVSVDPYLRIQMSTDDTWTTPAAENETQLSFAVARVLASTSAAIAVGQAVRTYTGWCEYAVLPASAATVIPAEPRIALEHYLGALGMVGRTSWWGVEHTLRPKAGETVVVSGAAGAVGSLVVQLCKRRGARVVGIAGSDAKVRYVRDELGADVVLNYRSDPLSWSHLDALRAACPNGTDANRTRILTHTQASYSLTHSLASVGIDCYWDNTGGDATDAVFRLLNVHARVAICGQIAVYSSGLNSDQPAIGPRLLHLLIYKRALVEGILQRDATPEVDALHQREATEWLLDHDHPLVDRFTIRQGFENIPATFVAMMRGDNLGKMLAQV